MTKSQKQYSGAKTLFSTNGAGETGHPYAKKKKKRLDTNFTLFTKNKSKWIIDPNLKLQTVKPL